MRGRKQIRGMWHRMWYVIDYYPQLGQANVRITRRTQPCGVEVLKEYKTKSQGAVQSARRMINRIKQEQH